MMLRRTGVAVFLFTFIHFSSSPSFAQEFAREISQFVGDNARPFLRPIADGLHTDVHAALFTPVVSDGLHIGVQAVVMGITIPDGQKSFKPKPYSKTVEFTYNGLAFLGDLDIAPASLPTAAGLGKKQTFSGRLKRIRPKGLPYTPGPYDLIQQDASVTIGGYSDISTLVVATPQITVGSYFNSELSIRFLPAVTVEDIGEVKSFGIGLKHDISGHFRLPVDISAQLMYQNLTITATTDGYDAGLDLSSVSAQLFASKSFPFGAVSVSPYAGFGYESGSVEVRYDFADPYIGKQNLTFESGSQVRFIGGLSLKIWKIRLNAEYNAALYDGFGAGFGVEL